MYISKVDDAFEQSIEGCLAETIKYSVLTNNEWSAWFSRADKAVTKLKAEHIANNLPLLSVADNMDNALTETEEAYQRLARGAQKIIFLGTGGSALGGQTLAQFGTWGLSDVSSNGQNTLPTTRFFGNLDPDTMESLVNQDDLASQRFVIISKSGSTPETLSQAIAILDAVRKRGLEAKSSEMFLGISDPEIPGKINGLRQLCTMFDIPTLNHPPNIGGRFAIFTCVGLLPAIAHGLSIRQLLQGAKAAISNILSAKRVQDCPAAVGAAIAAGLYEDRTARIQVVMPYANRLAQLARWYVQLRAESLGKDGKGITPLACLGPLDQHSQLQLFMDGPNDYYLTFIRTPLGGTGPVLPPDLCAHAEFEIMKGRTIGDLIDAQTTAVPEALRQAGRAVRTIDVPNLNEFALGALLMHFILETLIAADLIGVDPFGQPAVELGKKLTRQKLAEINLL
ncbi:MAG: glucose-6-phosphate isomerase [Hyphomicrobiaceae bacterium]|nr:glucose-6-phosphate isomerase [Hyphomicrobiaceae bacterium]